MEIELKNYLIDISKEEVTSKMVLKIWGLVD